MAGILILGAGAMGSAFCFPAADAGHSVRLVGTHLDLEWIDSVRETGVHPKLKMKLPEQVLAFTHDQLSEALSRASPGLWSSLRLLSATRHQFSY
jgi:glycerol-3-phosphate dehydrogenase (NAD(P)+)